MFSKFEGSSSSYDLNSVRDLEGAVGFHFVQLFSCCEDGKVKTESAVSRVWLFATPWTMAHQAPPSVEFSRQEYWSGLPVPSPEDLPDPEIAGRCFTIWATRVKMGVMPYKLFICWARSPLCIFNIVILLLQKYLKKNKCWYLLCYGGKVNPRFHISGWKFITQIKMYIMKTAFQDKMLTKHLRLLLMSWGYSIPYNWET